MGDHLRAKRRSGGSDTREVTTDRCRAAFVIKERLESEVGSRWAGKKCGSFRRYAGKFQLIDFKGEILCDAACR